MSKIVKLQADNFKRLKAVEISPDGNLVVIAGRNGQGKTSVLDAITAALGGNNTKTLPRPIRDGEDNASIVLETEDLIVTRTFSGTTSKLTVKGKDGATYTKGQAKLDELLGKLSLDPLAFTNLTDRDQLTTLLDLVDLPFKPADLEAERAKAFAERTDVNRRVKELQGQISAIPVTKEMADLQEVSVSGLLADYRASQELNHNIDVAHTARDGWAEKVERVKRELADAQQQLKTAQERVDSAPAKVDLDAIQSQIDNAEQINADVRTFRSWIAASDAHSALQLDAKELTDQLEAIDKRKADGLASATFPVDGLGFDADGVTYQGIPFKQASGAEQLRVSLAMAIALNPGLRVIRIADGSLLDSTNLQLIEDMAVANDYQVWIEMVNESGDFGIVIEDGEVA